jgi:hypothetical protein
MSEEATFVAGCSAVLAVLARLSALLRSHPMASAQAIGSWTVPEVACHVSHVIATDTDALSGGELPSIELSPADVAVMTDARLAADPERDLVALADRLDALGATFLELRAHRPAGPVAWVGGTKLPPSAVVCHLLEELLVHGYDVARAVRTSWRMEPAHAALAITGGALPIIAASPQSWIRPGTGPHTRARVDIRLRGFERFVLDARAEGLFVEMPAGPGADVHLSAAPVELLLVMLGRLTPWRAALAGKVFGWGRRPLALRTFQKVVTPP